VGPRARHSEDKQQVIFEEFKRLDSHQTRAEKGLGLGLAIADGLCRVLDTPCACAPGRARQRVQRQRAAGQGATAAAAAAELNGKLLSGAQVLCIDNEDSILIGMNSLLTRWGCQVWTARNRDECAALLDEGVRPQLALVDYHLDHGETGTELMGWLRTRLGEPVPGW
jgi:hypothetical protein